MSLFWIFFAHGIPTKNLGIDLVVVSNICLLLGKIRTRLRKDRMRVYLYTPK
jgi:hypothetical protein